MTDPPVFNSPSYEESPEGSEGSRERAISPGHESRRRHVSINAPATSPSTSPAALLSSPAIVPPVLEGDASRTTSEDAQMDRVESVTRTISNDSLEDRILPSERTMTSFENLRRPSKASISTIKILKTFSGSDSIEDMNIERKRTLVARREVAREALNRLQSAIEHPVTYKSLTNRLFPGPTKPSVSKKDWDAVIDFFAPRRADLAIYVLDIRANSAELTTSRLSKVERYMENKPADVEFRWIHVPVGRGLIQSTVEDLFNYTGSRRMGKPFYETGTREWPYCDLNTISFYDQDNLQEQIDAVKALQTLEHTPMGGFSRDPLVGLTDRQKHDLEWRSREVKRDLNYWDMVNSDFPFVLDEAFLGHGSPLVSRQTLASHGEHQALSRHPEFEKAILMTNELRCFHRNDGYLMTCSYHHGIDYLGKNFKEALKLPQESVQPDAEATVVGHVMHTFLDSGTSEWDRKTVEWLIVYLLSEAAVTPHNIRHGRSLISHLQAFSDLSKDFNAQKQEPLVVKGQRIRLVNKYVDCVQTLKALKTVTAQKLEAMKSLKKDAERMEAEYDREGIGRGDHPDAESMEMRLDWAISVLSSELTDIERMITHFQETLNIIFQQQSIELNELAVAADSQNNAILIFTGVTVVFLPLSFFTSYFGMNLQGVAAGKNEAYFWEVCGSITLLIVAFMFVTAFKQKIATLLWKSISKRHETVPFGILGASDGQQQQQQQQGVKTSDSSSSIAPPSKANGGG